MYECAEIEDEFSKMGSSIYNILSKEFTNEEISKMTDDAIDNILEEIINNERC